MMLSGALCSLCIGALFLLGIPPVRADQQSMSLAGIWPFRFGMTHDEAEATAKALLAKEKPFDFVGIHTIPEKTLGSAQDEIEFEIKISDIIFDYELYFHGDGGTLDYVQSMALRSITATSVNVCGGDLDWLSAMLM